MVYSVLFKYEIMEFDDGFIGNILFQDLAKGEVPI